MENEKMNIDMGDRKRKFLDRVKVINFCFYFVILLFFSYLIVYLIRKIKN